MAFSRKNQYEVDAMLALQGFFPSPFYSRYATLRCPPAPISSPLAIPQTEKLEYTKPPLRRWWPDMQDDTRRFFNRLRRIDLRLQYHEESAIAPVLCNKGCNPFLAFEGRTGRPNAWHQGWDHATLSVGMDEIFDRHGNPDKHLFIQRTSNSALQRIDYFIINYDLDNLRVNSFRCPRNTILGPLQDFCVIEIGACPIFWYRTRDALLAGPSRQMRTRNTGDIDSEHLPHCQLEIQKEILGVKRKLQECVDNDPEEIALRKEQLDAKRLKRDQKKDEGSSEGRTKKKGASRNKRADQPRVNGKFARAHSPRPQHSANDDDGNRESPTDPGPSSAQGRTNVSASPSISDHDHPTTAPELPHGHDPGYENNSWSNCSDLSAEHTDDNTELKAILDQCQRQTNEEPAGNNNRTACGNGSPGQTRQEKAQSKPTQTPNPQSEDDWEIISYHSGRDSDQEQNSQPGSKSGSTDNEPHYSPYVITRGRAVQIRNTANLADEQVILAIASVWIALFRVDPSFSFGDHNLFQICARTRLYGITYAVDSDTFMIPIRIRMRYGQAEEDRNHVEPAPKQAFWEFQKEFSDSDEILEDGHERKKGHYVLAIARRSLTKINGVDLSIYDSAPGAFTQGVIRRAARNIVRNSGWLGNLWPEFGFENWLEVPMQLFGSDACGIHVILNAWAHMLGMMPVRDARSSIPNYDDVLDFINRTLRGLSTIAEIRAMLVAYEFCEAQAQTDPSVMAREDSMQSVVTNEGILREFISDRRAEHRQRVFWPADSSTPSPPPTSKLRQNIYEPHTPSVGQKSSSSDDSPSGHLLTRKKIARLGGSFPLEQHPLDTNDGFDRSPFDNLIRQHTSASAQPVQETEQSSDQSLQPGQQPTEEPARQAERPTNATDQDGPSTHGEDDPNEETDSDEPQNAQQLLRQHFRNKYGKK